MDTIEIIKKRRSIRGFEPDLVPQDLIKKIIEAATWAPSACNIQGWRFIVVDDQKLKDKLVELGGAATIKSAPLGILVVYDQRSKNMEYQDHIQSGAAAIQNLLLAATHYGLGSCWICQLPLKNEIRKIFKIPESFSPMAYVLLGYPEREQKEVPRLYRLDDLIGYNRFNANLSEQKLSHFNLFIYRFFRKAYYLLPGFTRKRLNKFIDRKFVKKFDN